jgi:hypothetical protein
MAKQSGRDNRGSGNRSDVDQDDERLGKDGDAPMGGLVPLIPLEAQDGPGDEANPLAHASGDHRYARDDSDRALDEREHGDRELSDDERLELFRLSLFQNQLPSLPQIPGFHMCWLTTANPRDSIQGRLRLGYTLVRAAEMPGWEHSVLTGGQFEGCVGVNEMVAAKLPLRLFEMYMTEAHHNQPLAEEGKLRATLDAIRDQARGKGAALTLEEGMAALGQRPRRAHFEEIHGPVRTVPFTTG